MEPQWRKEDCIGRFIHWSLLCATSDWVARTQAALEASGPSLTLQSRGSWELWCSFDWD